ncbi:MAG: glycoside hydrolase family 3 N-terminal domain-containing protein, partial [Anaerolineales bacterium]
TPTPTPVPTLTPPPPTAAPDFHQASLPIEQRVDALLAQMTLAEKIGQMTQVENNSIKPDDVTAYFIGSVLTGGGSISARNLPADWYALTDGYQQAALSTRLGIPLLYGIDSVHGDAHVYGAIVFPHNIGLGATRDAALVEQIGRITAQEMSATGVRWNFAPVIAVPQDIRWGRTYEGYSENTDLVTQLGVAYIKGMQDVSGQPALSDPTTVLATPKHFIGDGGTAFGTSRQTNYLLDQGDTQMDEAALRALFLPPYKAAVDAGARSIMVSFSSWNGTKMHAQKHLLTDVLKGELGFSGFLVSDWQGIDQIGPDYYTSVVTAINAGVDMAMVPYDYKRFITTLTQAVTKGDVPMARIDDAARRILRVKFEMGLFEHPTADKNLLAGIGSDANRQAARQAVRESLVLLKNQAQTLPLAKDTAVIFVAGQGANDMGIQSGGWTIEWQGKTGPVIPGATILDGIKQTVSANTRVEFNRFGKFDSLKDAKGKALVADVGIAVVSETPYAEGVGDRQDLSLSSADQSMIDQLKQQSKKLVVIVVSGRPLVLTGQLPKMDALVAAWLPGTAGEGVADVLFGDADFTGKLPYTWPRWNSQLPFNFKTLPASGCDAALFPFAYGLTAKETSPEIPDCPEK